MRRFATIGISLLIAALALAACGGTPRANTTTTARVTRGDLVRSVSGSGQIQPARDINLDFGTTGTVASVRVIEGQKVKQGAALASLDTRELDQQVMQAEANLKSAQAALADLKDGPKESDVRSAKAQLEAARAQLNQQMKGNARPSDIASARAQLRSAQADLAALKNPTADDLSAAQLRVTQAQANLQTTRDGDSAAKTRAELDLHKAADALTQAQSSYSTALQNWQYVQDTGKDPVNLTTDPKTGKREHVKLSDAQRQQYYDTFVKAQAAMRSAEDAVKQAQIAYDNARQKEAADVPLAEAQLADAQRQLDALLQPDAKALAAAEAKVAQAQAQISQLTGGTKSDITVAQATVEQRQAALDALMAAPAAKDLAQAEANAAQAEAALSQAQINRAHAELVASFDGTVAAVNIEPGDSSGAGSGSAASDSSSSSGSSGAIYLIDDSSFHVDVKVSEADLAQLKLGQEAQIELDALPGQEIKGTLAYIAPTATTEQNVTTYLTRVDIVPAAGTVRESPLRAGMSAAVSIITDKRSNVVLVPNGAIRETDSGPQVQVKRGDQTILAPIKIGLAGDAETEVIEGLQPGDTVVLPGPRPTNRGPFGG